MSSRKRSANRVLKKATKQQPGYVLEYAQDQNGKAVYVEGAPAQEDQYRVSRQRPNRAFKRLIYSLQRKGR